MSGCVEAALRMGVSMSVLPSRLPASQLSRTDARSAWQSATRLLHARLVVALCRPAMVARNCEGRVGQ